MLKEQVNAFKTLPSLQAEEIKIRNNFENTKKEFEDALSYEKSLNSAPVANEDGVGVQEGIQRVGECYHRGDYRLARGDGLAHARQRLLLLLGLRLLAALQLGAQLLVLLLPRDGLRERLELPGAVADDGVHLLAVGLLQRLRDASLARVFLRGAGVARRSRPGGPR